MRNGLTSWSGRRAECSRHGQQRQDGRGAWPARQATGDECHPCVGHFLKTVSTVASLNSDLVIHHPTDRRCLTVISS